MACRFLYILILALGWIAQPLRAEDPTARPAPKFLPKGELRVGIDPEQPPMIFVQDKKIAGLEADLARAFAIDLGVPLTFTVMEWDELIPALAEGKIDIIMSGMSATEVRSVRVNFCTPYLVTGQMPLVRAGDVSRYPTTMALKNAQGRVGVETGTTGDFLVREQFLYAERVGFKDIQEAARALSMGNIDMVVADAPTVWYLAGASDGGALSPVAAVLTQERIAWAVSKTNPDLQAAADSFLVKLQGAGELDKIIAKWLPFTKK